ncbi:hypothetical protein BH11ARM2_BH11ARM2_34760 [soil metagenome]
MVIIASVSASVGAPVTVGCLYVVEMNVKVSGLMRRRSVIRIGKLRKDLWAEEPFDWSIDLVEDRCSDFEEVAEGLELMLEGKRERVAVHAKIKNHHFILETANITDERTHRFSVLTIGGVEVTGIVAFAQGVGHSVPELAPDGSDPWADGSSASDPNGPRKKRRLQSNGA